ncbi:predicted protein [Naegleria gruberi]|uniref:Predicted protein n=1 Tax=Naegleria gruberi TaxID=5762 RepID=D2V6C1_NAEGR|nr:uncharacterized protein NAEGRDRAFT_64383 [Naegleria gruberi]EFC47544.1 predicted protein [Naegleria gruberi]|eukprot:XP_002680288.1 predicted protein [Naegleria gruberi strain NEG-M]
MIRPQSVTKRVHLARFKVARKSLNRRTVTHRPNLSSSLKFRDNRQKGIFNKDWAVQTIPTHHYSNARPSLICKREKFRLATINKKEWTTKKALVSRQGRERIQMIQDSNRVNNLKQIDRMLLSYRMRMLNKLNKLPTTGQSAPPPPTKTSSSSTPVNKKGIVPSQSTLKQLKKIVQKHMEEVKGGPNIPKKSSSQKTVIKK